MDLETLFSIATRGVLVGWLLLIFLPRWRWSARLVSGVLLPALLSALYLVLIVRYWGSSDGGFDSLAGVQALLSHPPVLLAGWVHYLAFDLFIGAWEVRDAKREGIHHLLVVPCLALTFVFGPIGLLLYVALRAVLRRRVAIDEAARAV